MSHDFKRTYYISFDAQGYDFGTVKVEANNELEAKGKALDIFAGCMLDISYNVYADTEKPESCPEVYLDENGEEIDFDEEE